VSSKAGRYGWYARAEQVRSRRKRPRREDPLMRALSNGVAGVGPERAQTQDLILLAQSLAFRARSHAGVSVPARTSQAGGR